MGLVNDELKFVETASPHAWWLTAVNLHEQAVALKKLSGRSIMTHHNATTGAARTWDMTNKSVFLLGGFALENAIKAFLVFENPQWISNGRLSTSLKSHKLTSLQSRSAKIPFKSRYLNVLKGFENGLESWARYPCGLSTETSGDEENMHEKLWAGYARLMQAYNNRLVNLMEEGWKGPHGFYGRWTFSGDYLTFAK